MSGLSSGSRLTMGKLLFWGKIAQHMGVANISNVPHNAVCIGKLTPGNLFKTPLFSKLFMTIGGKTSVFHI